MATLVVTITFITMHYILSDCVAIVLAHVPRKDSLVGGMLYNGIKMIVLFRSPALAPHFFTLNRTRAKNDFGVV